MSMPVDLVILSAYIYWEKPTPDSVIAELIIVPALIIINLIIAGVTTFFSKKRYLGWTFLINGFLASFIFHYLFQLWFTYYDYVNFKNYYFERSGKNYRLELDRRDTSYSLLELNNGDAMEFKTGKYKQLSDRVLLADSASNLFIYQHHLIGYPKAGDNIALQDGEPKLH
jgi:hypothetical protein